MPEKPPITTRLALLEEIIDLRHEVLRQGLPRSEAIFPGDELPNSVHIGAFADGRTIGCVTAHLNEWQDQPAFQIRGMATAADFRGNGVGRSMLDLLESTIRERSPIRSLWCNARVPASAFYQKLGWEIVSGVFDIPTAGPHVKMTKRMT